MKRTSISLVFSMAVLVSCVGFATPVGATPLTIGNSDPYYLGFIEDAEPASPSDEVGYINTLLGLAAPGTVEIGGRDYIRSTNTLCGYAGLCPDAVIADAQKDDTNPSTTVDTEGYTYLLAKYDGPNFGSVVWYVADLPDDIASIPATGGGFGMSHWSLYNLTPDGPIEDPLEVTPEPTTMLLLGSGLVVVAARLRRRRNT